MWVHRAFVAAGADTAAAALGTWYEVPIPTLANAVGAIRLKNS